MAQTNPKERASLLNAYVKVLGNTKGNLLREWEQGYVAACGDSQEDKIAMLARFNQKVPTNPAPASPVSNRKQIAGG